MSIEAFRGFRDAQTISLDANVVILSGPNGSGKTSVFDALLWLLTGSIPRLRELQQRKEEYVVNQYSLPGRAAVEALLVLDGAEYLVRRSGRHDSDYFEVRRDGTLFSGDEARTQLLRVLRKVETMPLEVLFASSGLLQQDVIRGFLESPPADVHSQLTAILGLGNLETFEDDASDRLKDLRAQSKQADLELTQTQRQVSSRSDLLATLRTRVSARATVNEANTRFSLIASQHAPLLRARLPESAEEARALREECSILRSRLVSAAERLTLLEDRLRDTSPASPIDLETSEASILGLKTELEQKQRELRELQETAARLETRHEALQQLAARALPLLGDTCPVCDQPIDAQQIAERLQHLVGDESELAKLRQQEADSRTKVAELNSRLAGAEDDFNRLRGEIKDRERLQQDVAAIREGVALSRTAETRVSLLVDALADASVLASVESALRDLERATEQVELTYRSAGESSEIQQSEAQLRSYESRQRELESRSERLASDVKRWEKLVRASREARVEVIRRRLTQLQPLFTDVFLRLDPHPTFKSLDMEHDVYYSKGTARPIVRDAIADREANPSLVLSASQANIVALSYFLAMGQALGESALPFVLLDDPLQSMDDVNVLGLADLCRFIRRRRQLVISTHDRRFAGVLERKLAPRSETDSTLHIRFTGWDRSGPDITVESVEPQLREGRERLILAS